MHVVAEEICHVCICVCNTTVFDVMLFAAHMLQPKSLEPCPANRVLKVEISLSKQN